MPVNSFQAILEWHKDKGVPEIDLMATSTNACLPCFLLPLAGARGSSSKCPSPGLDTMENNLSLSSSLADSPCNAEARDLPRPRHPILYWTPAEPWFIKIQMRAFLCHPLSFFRIHDFGPTSSTPWTVFSF